MKKGPGAARGALRTVDEQRFTAPRKSHRFGAASVSTQRRIKPTQAAFCQAAVSKALHIIGMFMPKFGLMPFFGTATLTAGLGTAVPVLLLLLLWATSVARSHDPISWERATEKNRNT